MNLMPNRVPLWVNLACGRWSAAVATDLEVNSVPNVKDFLMRRFFPTAFTGGRWHDFVRAW